MPASSGRILPTPTWRAGTRCSSSTTSRRAASTTSATCAAHPRFHYTIESVHHAATVAELVDQCDVVFHLAAAVGVRLIVESPVRTIETNVHGTEVVLAQANKKKKKVLIASTSEVYGLSTQVPFREDGNLVLGPHLQGAAGATPAPRRSTSSWRWPTGASGSCRR